jgi:hypothetical protein
MMTPILAIAMACVAIKFRQWHDQTQTEISLLKVRVKELEQALVRDECLNNDYKFTTRRATTIDMES